MGAFKDLFSDEGDVIKVFEPENLDSLHPCIRTFITYVRNNAENKDRPSRKFINPADLQPLLPFIAIVDTQINDGELEDVYVRLIGTEMVNVYGEMTGMNVSQYENPVVGQRIIDDCSFVVQSKQIAVGSVSKFDESKNFIKLKKVYIPFFDDVDDKDKVSQIMVLVQFGV